MSKPKQIKITRAASIDITPGKVYDVIRWYEVGNPVPHITTDTGQELTMMSSKWEPVIQPGDPVWAWDEKKSNKKKGLYIGKSVFNKIHPYHVDSLRDKRPYHYKNIAWRYEKQKITIAELAKKAGINLNEYEVIE